jgi:hypothetical protein
MLAGLVFQGGKDGRIHGTRDREFVKFDSRSEITEPFSSRKKSKPKSVLVRKPNGEKSSGLECFP